MFLLYKQIHVGNSFKYIFHSVLSHANVFRPVWGRLDVKDSGMRKLFWPCEYAGFYTKNPKLHQVYSDVDDFV